MISLIRVEIYENPDILFRVKLGQDSKDLEDTGSIGSLLNYRLAVCRRLTRR